MIHIYNIEVIISELIFFNIQIKINSKIIKTNVKTGVFLAFIIQLFWLCLSLLAVCIKNYQKCPIHY